MAFLRSALHRSVDWQVPPIRRPVGMQSQGRILSDPLCLDHLSRFSSKPLQLAERALEPVAMPPCLRAAR